MPSNRELIEQVKTLSSKLGVAVETHGLNNTALIALVADLESRTATESESIMEPKRTGEAIVEEHRVKVYPESIPIAPPEPKRSDPVTSNPLTGEKITSTPQKTDSEFSIAMGKSLVTKRGVLAEYSEVLPSDFSDGMNDIEHHLKLGFIVRGSKKV
jgi:hypothetical protein